MEIKLTHRQIQWAKADTYFGPEFKKENAATPQDSELRTFLGYCGEIAVLSAFCGSLVDESIEHRGDWVSQTNKLYEIKTQNKRNRKYPLLSFDLNDDQYQSVFKKHNANGGILCSVDCSSIEEFENNPIVTIEFWAEQDAIATAVPRNKSNSRHNITKSVYADDEDRVRTDFNNL
jgi:hypothetical protein